MLTRIMRHDLQLLAADKTLWIVAALFAVLIGYGTFNGARWAHERARLTAELQTRGEKSLTALQTEAAAFETGAKAFPQPSPGSTAPAPTPAALLPTGKSTAVVLSPAPLTALSVGQADIYPFSASVDIYTSKHQIFNVYEQDNPLNLLAGRFDLAFVFVFLFPLLILVLSYNLLSAEKESGTLQMTLAQSPIGLQKLLTGKVLTRLLIVLGIAIGFSFIGFLLAGINLIEATVLPRLLLWLAVVSSYALFWFALAVLVNSFGFSSATNAVVLAGAWIALVVVSPALLNVAANAFYPTPSRIEFVSKQREADNYTRGAGEKLLAEYYGDHPELVPKGKLDFADFTRRFYAVRQEMQRRMLPEVERFEQQTAAQNRLVNRFRVLSPAIVTQEAFNDIAGTSEERQQSFVAQIRTFISSWQEFFVPRVMRKEAFKSTDYEQIPRFQFQEETTNSIAARVGAGLVLLLAPTVLLLLLTALRLRKFPLLN
jgi:ABC-2 type transport system permease protein